MISPKAKFTNSQGNENAPIGECRAIQYGTGENPLILGKFQKGLERFSSLKAYFDECKAPRCGNTEPSNIGAISNPNQVGLSVGARHVGMVEIWIDDQMVLQRNQLLDSYDVDYSLCKKQTCVLRLLMAAIHLPTAELYDNCVTIRGSGLGSNVPTLGQMEAKRQHINEG